MNVKIGDIVSRPKAFGAINHIGVCVEYDQIFHNNVERGAQIESLDQFAEGKPVTVIGKTEMAPHELHMRAWNAVQEKRPYDTLTNNCEHAITRLLGVQPTSPQLSNWIAGFAAVAAFFVLASTADA